MNPTTHLAIDYINTFNEIVMLIEQLPEMPSLIHNIQAWQARSYTDYFTHSPLPGHADVVTAYNRLEPHLRNGFEEAIAELKALVTNAVMKVSQCACSAHPCLCSPSCLKQTCAQTTKKLRASLNRARHLINPIAANDECGEQARIDAYFR